MAHLSEGASLDVEQALEHSRSNTAERRIRALTKKIDRALEAGDPERAEAVNKELLAIKAELPTLRKQDHATRLPAEWTPGQVAEARERDERIEQRETEMVAQYRSGEIDAETYQTKVLAMTAHEGNWKPREMFDHDDPHLARIECEYRRLRRNAKVVMLPSRPQTRARGAGAPAFRGSSRRSSARSGDSGGEDPEKEPERSGASERPAHLTFAVLDAATRGDVVA